MKTRTFKDREELQARLRLGEVWALYKDGQSTKDRECFYKDGKYLFCKSDPEVMQTIYMCCCGMNTWVRVSKPSKPLKMFTKQQLKTIKNCSKFKYPLYFKSKFSNKVVKFKGLKLGKVVKGDCYINDKKYNTSWTPHTETTAWEPIPAPPKLATNKLISKLVKKFDDGWEADWSNPRQVKCGVAYHLEDEEWKISHRWHLKDIGTIYMSKPVFDKVVEHLNKEGYVL